ncbi:hypothetical protein U1Q18_043723, partial [Sarracenia purpurea var. burkii]
VKWEVPIESREPKGNTIEEERHETESGTVVEVLRNENAQLLKQIDEMKEREEGLRKLLDELLERKDKEESFF